MTIFKRSSFDINFKEIHVKANQSCTLASFNLEIFKLLGATQKFLSKIIQRILEETNIIEAPADKNNLLF